VLFALSQHGGYRGCGLCLNLIKAFASEPALSRMIAPVCRNQEERDLGKWFCADPLS
jgi:hypothetical protein